MLDPKYMQDKKIKNVDMSIADFRTLHDYFVSVLNKPGKNISFSLLCAANAELMGEHQKDCVKLLDENIEKPINVEKEYNEEMTKLLLQYADRDEQGTPLKDKNGQYIVIDQLTEFNEAGAKVQKKYEEIYAKELLKQQTAYKYMQDTIINTDMIAYSNLTDYPETLEPAIVDVLARYI